jgi:VWA domain-containing protein
MAIARPLPRRLPKPRRDAIPVAGAAFRRQARRHALVRAALAAGLLGALLFAFVLARRLPEGQSGVLPPGSSGVVMLDLSASINSNENAAINETLRKLAGSRDRFGLVLFSDNPYEAMPPGTPALHLGPLLRYYKPSKVEDFSQPLTPWSYGFRGGTRISTAIEMALGMLERDHVRKGGLVLISDLFDAPSDATALQRALLRIQEAKLKVRVVALAPGSSDARFFAQVLGKLGVVGSAASVPERTRHTAARGATPTWLVVVGALLLVLLALNELLCGRLTWRRQPA